MPWCMSGSLARSGGENVPGIPDACAALNFTYLVRGPFSWEQFYSQCPNTILQCVLKTIFCKSRVTSPMDQCVDGSVKYSCLLMSVYLYIITAYIYNSRQITLETSSAAKFCRLFFFQRSHLVYKFNNHHSQTNFIESIHMQFSSQPCTW